MSEVNIKVRLVIDDESKKERAERILEKSEAVCLIFNLIKIHKILLDELVVDVEVMLIS